jgi:hypothetical protein
MANQDFLITFSVDGTQALRMMEQIGQKATALEGRLNALGRGTTSGGGGGVLAGLGLAPNQVRGSISALDRLEGRVAELKAVRTTAGQLGFQMSAGALRNEAIATRRLAETLTTTSSKYQTLTNDAARLTAQSVKVAGSTDQATQAFGRHTQRIFEAIIVYEAFGRSVQALKSGFDLIIDIDRETRRLEAVLEIDPTASTAFVQRLGEIASNTVTPLKDLVSEADRASAAFLNIEDPTARATASLELMDAAGKFTTVTQRNLGVEINNVIAIMKQLEPLGLSIDDILGKIVVAGGNSSTVIAGLADSLQISARAAIQAGVNLDVLLGIESEFLIQTGRTGSEVGNIFKLLFQRLADPDVVGDVESITNGLLKMRDAAGTIRDPIQIMLELNSLMESGAISATQFRDVIDTIAPPLNPAAKADFILINELLQDIGGRVREIAGADSSALDQLVDRLNEALGPQFQKLIIDAQNAFVKLFGEEIEQAGFDLIEVIRGIGEALSTVDPATIRTITHLVAFLATLKLISFTAIRLGGLLGLAGLSGAIRTFGVEAATTSRFTASAISTMGNLGGAAATTTRFILGAANAFGPLLAAIALFMAIDFAQKIGEMQEALKTQIGGSLVGMDANALRRRREQIVGNLSPQAQAGLRGEGPGLPDLRQFTTDPALIDALEEIDRLLLIVGNDGSVAADQVGEGFRNVATDIAQANDEAQSSQFLANISAATDPLTVAQRQADEYAASLARMGQVERDAAVAGDLLKTLTDEKAEAFRKLNERLKEGEISERLWAQGQTEVQQAADISARLVATFGDQLRTMIPILADAGAGNEALASALFDVIIQSTNGLPSILNWANSAIRVGQGAAIAATGIAAWAQSQFALGSTFAALREGSAATFNFAAAQLHAIGQAAIGTSQTLAQVFANLNNIFAHSGSASFGTGGGGGSTASVKDRGLLDAGDFTKAQIDQAVALARALQSAIPGANAEHASDFIDVIKDAKFLETIKGLDQRLLQIAIEELTQQMEEANRLEQERLQKEAVLRNLVVNAGPLGALVSQPSLFGVAGSLAGGTGLNFDPTKGNFVINVPVELQGLQPAQLQQLIYDIISKAIRDATRT